MSTRSKWPLISIADANAISLGARAHIQPANNGCASVVVPAARALRSSARVARAAHARKLR